MDRRRELKLKTDIRSVSYMKAHAADLLEQVNREGRPVVITQKGEPRAVILDPESYDRLRTSIGLLKLIAQGEEAIREGDLEEQEALFSRLGKNLGKRR